MSVAPIKKISVVEQAISRIYDLILAGNLKEKDRLPPERQLSEMLGISRNSLREAIRVLDMLGIVRVDQGSGMVIDTSKVSDSVTRHLSFALLLNREKLNELFEARLLVETECAALAARRADSGDIAEMKSAYEELANSGANREKGIRCELKLHSLIAKAARNSVLEKILASLREILKVSRQTTVPASGVTAETIESQRRIIDAIERKDEAEARELMRKHISRVAERVKSVGVTGGSSSAAAEDH
jgi:GntR family transcriptional repressor for pyruvate dehydrogenase complex